MMTEQGTRLLQCLGKYDNRHVIVRVGRGTMLIPSLRNLEPVSQITMVEVADTPHGPVMTNLVSGQFVSNVEPPESVEKDTNGPNSPTALTAGTAIWQAEYTLWEQPFSFTPPTGSPDLQNYHAYYTKNGKDFDLPMGLETTYSIFLQPGDTWSTYVLAVDTARKESGPSNVVLGTAPSNADTHSKLSLLDRARQAPGFRNLGSLTNNAFREADIAYDGTNYHVFSTHAYETESAAHRSASTPEGVVSATATIIAPVKYPSVVKDGSTWHLWGTITSPVGTVHYTAASANGPYTLSDTVNIPLIDMSVRKHPTNKYWYGAGFENGADTPMKLIRASSPNGPWTDMGDVFADAGEPPWSTYSRPDPNLAFIGGRNYVLFGGFPFAGAAPPRFGIVELNIVTGRVKGSAVVHYDEPDAWSSGGLGDHTFLSVVGQPDRIFAFQNANTAGDFPWGVMELPEYPPLEDGRRHDDVVRLDMARGFDIAAGIRATTRANTIWRPEGIESTALLGGAQGYPAVANLKDFTMRADFTPSLITASVMNIAGSVCVDNSFTFPGRIQIYISSTGFIAAQVQSSDGTPVTTTLTSTIAAVVGTRYDVVFRKQGDEVKLWINGVLAATGTHAASEVLTGLYVWSVGAEVHSTGTARRSFVGTIHTFNVVGSALPPASTFYYPTKRIIYPPATPSGLVCVAVPNGSRVSWTQPTEPDYALTEIWVGTVSTQNLMVATSSKGVAEFTWDYAAFATYTHVWIRHYNDF